MVVTDDADKVLYSRRLPNNLTDVCGALSLYLKELFGVVVESTFNWYWLVDGLIDAGHSVPLANTVAIKQYDGLKYRGDESDARRLAHILRPGLLPEWHIMPRPLRAVRDLSRKRMQLVQQRTTQLLSIGTCLAPKTGGQISGDSIKRSCCRLPRRSPAGGAGAGRRYGPCHPHHLPVAVRPRPGADPLALFIFIVVANGRWDGAAPVVTVAPMLARVIFAAAAPVCRGTTTQGRWITDTGPWPVRAYSVIATRPGVNRE